MARSGVPVTAPRVAVVIVNHGTPEKTAAALAAVQRSDLPVGPLVVVENGSDDGSADRLRELPGVLLIESRRNRGFAGGANLGVRRVLDGSPADAVFLLNSDAAPAPDCLRLLLAAMDRTGAGLVGPVIVRASDARIETAGISYSRMTGRMRLVAAGRPRPAVPGPAHEVEALSGGALLVRRTVFEAIGLLAEEYFYGFEDLDFCLRARRRGFRSWCVPAAVVMHEGAASIGSASPRRLYFAARNHLWVADRALRLPPLFAWARTGNIVLLNVAHALVRSEVPHRDGLRAVARGVADWWRERPARRAR